ncbi:MAG: hypothetical protein P8N30_09485, partial [Tateyamaria sp.]|nr:hypothetical protein [Tateyamaria sp.]
SVTLRCGPSEPTFAAVPKSEPTRIHTLRDKPAIRFSQFADAALLCECCEFSAALQHWSRKRSLWWRSKV